MRIIRTLDDASYICRDLSDQITALKHGIPIPNIFVNVTLAAALQFSRPSIPLDSQELVYLVLNPSGSAISWNTDQFRGGPVLVPSACSVITFIGFQSKWYLKSYQSYA